MHTNLYYMPPKKALKYLLDVEQLIAELEALVSICERDYFLFNSNFMALRTAERNLELIGEAIRQMYAAAPEITINNAKDIIGLRNLLAHAYDNIDATALWKILIKDLPSLKAEVQEQIRRFS